MVKLSHSHSLDLHWPLKSESSRLSPPLEKILTLENSLSSSSFSDISSFTSTDSCPSSPSSFSSGRTPIADSIFPLPEGAILSAPVLARKHIILPKYKTPTPEVRKHPKLRSRKHSASVHVHNSKERSPSRTERTLVACSACHKAKACCDNVRPCSRCIRLGKSDCHDRVMAVTKTSVACVACHKAKSGCDTQRPCARCVRLGRGAECRDRAHKKPGRPRKVILAPEPWKEKRSADILQRSVSSQQKSAKRQKRHSNKRSKSSVKSPLVDCLEPLQASPSILDVSIPSAKSIKSEISNESPESVSVRPAPRLPPRFPDLLSRMAEQTDNCWDKLSEGRWTQPMFDLNAADQFNFKDSPPPLLEMISPQPHNPVQIKAINPLLCPIDVASRPSTPSEWLTSPSDSTEISSFDGSDPIESMSSETEASFPTNHNLSIHFSDSEWMTRNMVSVTPSPSDVVPDKRNFQKSGSQHQGQMGTHVVSENQALKDHIFMLSYENAALRSQIEFMHTV